MRIGYLDWKCFNGADTKREMEKQGHCVLPFFREGYNEPVSDEFVEYFLSFVKEKGVDLIFSYNFFPPLAEGAHLAGIPYISVVYDNPYVYLYSYTVMYDTNRIYLFDSDWVREMNAGGLSNIFYTVLPGDLKENTPDAGKYACDISFIGALYNEEHDFYSRMEPGLSPYMKGYLNGLMSSQHLIYGEDLIKDALTPDVLGELYKALPLEKERTCAEPDYYRFLKYVIDRRLTSIERIKYLTLLGEKFGRKNSIDLYTLDPDYRIAGIRNRGIAEYETVMPRVFAESRINLNVTLRSISSGIPQRCIDIMSNGGFLLSNYQSDFFLDTLTEDGSAAFVQGEDIECYSEEGELVEKTAYYLSHEEERKRIALNGYQKVKKYYSLEKFLKRIL